MTATTVSARPTVASMTVLQAIRDPNLFAGWFREPTTWRASACSSIACPLPWDSTSALDVHRATGADLEHLALVVGQGVGSHHLQGVEAGAIVHIDEGEARLGVAAGADPAFDGDALADGKLAVEYVCDAVLEHVLSCGGP